MTKSQVLCEARKAESEKRIFLNYPWSSSFLKNQALVFIPFMFCHFQNRILRIGGENLAENTDIVRSLQTVLALKITRKQTEESQTEVTRPQPYRITFPYSYNLSRCGITVCVWYHKICLFWQDFIFWEEHIYSNCKKSKTHFKWQCDWIRFR